MPMQMTCCVHQTFPALLIIVYHHSAGDVSDRPVRRLYTVSGVGQDTLCDSCCHPHAFWHVHHAPGQLDGLLRVTGSGSEHVTFSKAWMVLIGSDAPHRQAVIQAQSLVCKRRGC